MKITGFVSRTTLVAVLAIILTFTCLSATFGKAGSNEKKPEINPLLQKVLKISTQTEPNSPNTTESVPAPRARTTFVKSADFYLKDGRLVFGKLVSEDRNKVTIEELNGSEIIVNTYSRRDIDSRTLQTKSIPENRYYEDLAEYFAGRTWDFKDDPDDFIHAIRCYESAKRLITGTSRLDIERTQQIDQKIEHLRADRQIWEREVQSRAKLKELEFKAEYATKFSELEKKIDAGSQKIDDNVERIDKVIAEMQDSRLKLEQNIPLMEQEIRRQLSILADQIEVTRRVREPFYTYPRYRYRYGPYGMSGY
jgi:hypothetical protein